MTATDCAPAVITHFEFEHLLGGGAAGQRQRQRLQTSGILPEANWVRIDRIRIGVYPRFALIGLLDSARMMPSILEGVRRWSEIISRSSGITQLLDDLSDQVRDLGRWDYSVFAEQLGHSAGHEAMSALLSEALDELRTGGARLEEEVGRIVGHHDRLLRVEMRNRVAVDLLDATSLLTPEENKSVVVERVRVAG